jgi:hypothetical protein
LSIIEKFEQNYAKLNKMEKKRKMEPNGAFWSILEPNGATWRNMEQSGA